MGSIDAFLFPIASVFKATWDLCFQVRFLTAFPSFLFPCFLFFLLATSEFRSLKYEPWAFI